LPNFHARNVLHAQFLVEIMIQYFQRRLDRITRYGSQPEVRLSPDLIRLDHCFGLAKNRSMARLSIKEGTAPEVTCSSVGGSTKQGHGLHASWIIARQFQTHDTHGNCEIRVPSHRTWPSRLVRQSSIPIGSVVKKEMSVLPWRPRMIRFTLWPARGKLSFGIPCAYVSGVDGRRQARQRDRQTGQII
jgi:hypothetical protein